MMDNPKVAKLLFPESPFVDTALWNRLYKSDENKGLSKDKLVKILESNIQYCRDYVSGKGEYESRFNSKKKRSSTKKICIRNYTFWKWMITRLLFLLLKRKQKFF